jgi:hypothetical protein
MVTTDELAALRELATRFDLNLSEYVRRLISVEIRSYRELVRRGGSANGSTSLPTFALQNLADKMGNRDG